MMIAACVAVSALVLLKMPKTSTAPSPVPSGYIPPNVVDGRI
ncbi:MAG: hypothetical protein JWN89_702 [Parcubacteria group bacterium]|nr:hypothetical protein [Parcubacteria group bacterium]